MSPVTCEIDFKVGEKLPMRQNVPRKLLVASKSYENDKESKGAFHKQHNEVVECRQHRK